MQTVTRQGTEGVMTHDLSSTAAAHTGSYGFEVTVSKVFEKDYYGMLSLPAFLVTDHERMYTLAFWAKVPVGEPGAPKPRPHVTFQDEDNDYAWISGEFVQLSAIWHRYEVNLVVPYTLRGHNVVTNFMLGSQTGTYYFDDFEVTNRQFVSPPPSPPLPPPSPPPNVLLMLGLEDYVKGTVNPQAWPEGTMEVVVQSQAAAHSGKYGLMIKVTKAFESDWHAQVSLKPWTPIDTNHGYKFSFWARGAAANKGGKDNGLLMPKVVFQDADDSYTPVKQVTVPLTEDWRMYEADLSIPSFRRGHAIVINFWVGARRGLRTRSTTCRSTRCLNFFRRRLRRLWKRGASHLHRPARWHFLGLKEQMTASRRSRRLATVLGTYRCLTLVQLTRVAQVSTWKWISHLAMRRLLNSCCPAMYRVLGRRPSCTYPFLRARRSSRLRTQLRR